LDDYAAAVEAQPSVVLHHVPSEFSFTGAHDCATLDELVELCEDIKTPVVQCLDLATLVDLSAHCGDCATLVGQSVVTGADVVIFGGERLVGGPPCGIIVGRRSALKAIGAAAAARGLVANRLTLAALQGTLEQYREPGLAERQIPLLQMLSAAEANLKNRAERIAPQLANCAAIAAAAVCEQPTYVSANQVANQRLASWAVVLQPAQADASSLARRLREQSPAIWCRVQDDKLWLDLRGVLPRQDELIVRAIQGLPGPSASQAEPVASPGPAEVDQE
jgi:L-seryl-tRNA(Ser) seleniumtransferase